MMEKDQPYLKKFLNYLETAKKSGQFYYRWNYIWFRENLGGIHLKYKIKPDMAVLSKAMSNGYPSSAIIGIREVMDEAQDSFISSCMWTERIGFVSALATIKKFKRLSLQKKLIDHGQRIKKGWLQISKSTDVDINCWNWPNSTI